MSSNKKYNSAATSRADKVIDAVSDAQAKVSEAGLYGCPKCGHSKYSTRRALGGPLIKVCLSCGHKRVAPRGGVGVRPLLPENLYHEQGTKKGPFKSSSPKQKTEKHAPKYRSKGKTNDK